MNKMLFYILSSDVNFPWEKSLVHSRCSWGKKAKNAEVFHGQGEWAVKLMPEVFQVKNVAAIVLGSGFQNIFCSTAWKMLICIQIMWRLCSTTDSSSVVCGWTRDWFFSFFLLWSQEVEESDQSWSQTTLDQVIRGKSWEMLPVTVILWSFYFEKNII